LEVSGPLNTAKECADNGRMHVFADLQPYTCIFDSCRSMLRTFSNRKTWSEHELTEHCIWQSWKCHLCATTFTADAKFIEHLKLKHDLPQHHCKILAVSSLTKSTGPVAATDKQCPLCLQKGWSNHRRFVTHLGRHLEEIALSVLPRDIDSDSDQQTDGDEPSVLKSSVSYPCSRPACAVIVAVTARGSEVSDDLDDIIERDEPPRNNLNQIYCTHLDCSRGVPTFRTVTEWM
jgi:hypothetical protein